jgi:seryl-tRNA synthetase
MDDWLGQIYDLAEKIGRYRKRQDKLTRDKNRAWRRIKELQADYELETDTAVKKQIQITIDGLQKQYNALDSIENTMQRAELQLENSLAHLGTIYSQALLVDAKDIDSSRARRLRQEIDEEVDELNDVLLAMDEVYAQDSG